MDISIVNPLLLVSFLRYLAQKWASRGGKAYFAAFAVTLFAAGIVSVYDFFASKTGEDFGANLSTQRLVVFQGNSLTQMSNPFANSYITLGTSSGLSEGGQGFDLVRKVNVVVTAYSSTPWETDGNPYVTASGEWVKDGIVAINYLPFGTKVRIPEVFGDKVFVVQDRMHWRKGNYHVDVWFPSYKEALNFGAKRTHIEILES
ncbi:MAG: hypothetical protein G01um101430_467 [Parcubacteria group bacterium Gr01-1014_30]|nr:MAG: hypothetical protein G01um101430_467 [Parcubacteria group bacterium Gr01-1014_30]